MIATTVFTVSLVMLVSLLVVAPVVKWLYRAAGRIMLQAYKTPHSERSDLEALLVDLLQFRHDVLLRQDRAVDAQTHYFMCLHLNQYLSPNPYPRMLTVYFWARVIGLRCKINRRLITFHCRSTTLSVPLNATTQFPV